MEINTSGLLLSQIWIFLFFTLLAPFNYAVLAWLWMVKERVYITWIACALTIITAYILIKLYGIYWAWVAFWVNYIYTRVLSLSLLNKKRYSLSLKWRYIISNILLFLVLWLVIYFWKKYFINIDWNRWNIIIRLITIWLAFYSLIGLGNLTTIKNWETRFLILVNHTTNSFNKNTFFCRLYSFRTGKL